MNDLLTIGSVKYYLFAKDSHNNNHVLATTHREGGGSRIVWICLVANPPEVYHLGGSCNACKCSPGSGIITPVTAL